MVKHEFLARLLGNRPMRYVAPAFFDSVVHKQVNYYIDLNYHYWLAYNRWGFHRVPTTIESAAGAILKAEKS